MPALFSRTADTAFRVALGAAFLFASGAPIAAMAWVRTPQVTGQDDAVEQPVRFDHRHHVADAAIDCRYCHETAERSRYAGVPATSVCMSCHGQIWTDGPDLLPVRASFAADQPIVWNRVHRLPGYVYFDHSVHVSNGIGCVVCHGRVDEMAGVVQVAPLTMSWCIDCHRSPEEHARAAEASAPADERTPSLARRPEDLRRLTHCSTCHR